MKILIITRELESKNGGGQVMRSTISLLGEIVGKNSVYICSLSSINNSNVDLDLPASYSTKEKVINIVRTGQWFTSINSLRSIERFILNNGINVVFMGRSLYGHLSKRLKKDTNVKIVTLFHDIYPHVLKERLRSLSIFHSLKKMPMYINELTGEYRSVHLADATIVLNDRDRCLFKKYYRKPPSASVSYYEDVFPEETASLQCLDIDSNVLQLLFVGSYYWPNIQGVKWFMEMVLPSLDNVLLTIVGNGMEKLKHDQELAASKKVNIIGSVDDLSIYYSNCDIVVGPILSGTGMKIKTIEALMFDKLYLGTPEAYAGIDGMDDYVCATAEDFVQKIDHYRISKYRPLKGQMRKEYQTRFGFDRAVKIYSEIFSKIFV